MEPTIADNDRTAGPSCRWGRHPIFSSGQRRVATADADFVENACRTSWCRTPIESTTMTMSPDATSWLRALSVTRKGPPRRIVTRKSAFLPRLATISLTCRLPCRADHLDPEARALPNVGAVDAVQHRQHVALRPFAVDPEERKEDAEAEQAHGADHDRQGGRVAVEQAAAGPDEVRHRGGVADADLVRSERPADVVGPVCQVADPCARARRRDGGRLLPRGAPVRRAFVAILLDAVCGLRRRPRSHR